MEDEIDVPFDRVGAVVRHARLLSPESSIDVPVALPDVPFGIL